jgi:hypothetical protein
MSIRGNVCASGTKVLFDRVQRGELSLDTLFSGTVLRCDQDHHSDMCSILRLGAGKYFRPALTDIYSWAEKNVDVLVARPKLIKEVADAMTNAKYLVVWLGLWPLFRKSNQLHVLEKPIFLNRDMNSAMSNVGVLLGTARVDSAEPIDPSANLSFVTEDLLMYRGVVNAQMVSCSIKSPCGPGMGLYLSTVCDCCSVLPMELVILVLYFATGMTFSVDALHDATRRFSTNQNVRLALLYVSGVYHA